MELSSWRREVPFGAYLQPIHLTVVERSTKASKVASETPVGGSPPGSTSAPIAATAGSADKDGAELETNGGGDPATPTQQSDSTTATADSGSINVPSAVAAVLVSAVATPTTAVVVEANDVLSTPKRLKRRQKPAPPTTPPTTKASEHCEEAEEIKVIPPFESEYIWSNSDSTSSKDSSARMVMNVGGPVWALDWLPQDTSRRRKRNSTAAAATGMKKKGTTSVSNGGDATTAAVATATAAGNKENRAGDSEQEDDAAANRREMLAKKWRFLALATHPPCEVVDGKLVKKTPPDHYYNAEEDGARSLIQIWAVPVEPKKKITALTGNTKTAAVRKPKLVYGIDHHSGVAWDLQWSPIAHAMPRRIRSKNLLGVLAVCFGDGSLQVFEVPEIPTELLTTQGLRKHEARVEKLRPTIHAKVPRILQLSVQWSPHRWNLLLTGGSDGSVSLWNLEYELSKPEEPTENSINSPSISAPLSLPMEPQRRFQDVDTVGKQEVFDWGWGWVAVRSVSWSPFDEFIFATTGNDSVFKVWDIREPRICFRSHRIRSTWGLSLQWMDHTTIQISGDQGSIYMYDTLSGSCQKLHYHPQIDSPVWDLQFARRGGSVPLLVSCCTSGSVRVAPAKKLFRAPQHSIEFCRLSGEKDASVEREFKALTVNFAQKVVSATAESASPAMRQFCERDAALHRLRVSTSTTGAFPCFLAVGGHAGLVVILEVQEALDHLLENYFVSTNKKLGRPRKKGVGSPWSATKIKKSKKQLLALLMDGDSTGINSSSKKVRGPSKKHGSHIKSKNMHNALTKYSSKTKKKAMANGKKAGASGTTTPVKESEFPQFEMKTDSEEEEEEDDSEEESDAGLELMMAEEHSDDERISYSDGDMADEEEFEQQRQMLAQFNPENARMMTEYQLDLSEEDAIMLAIHMSELEQVQASPPQKPSTSTAKASKAKPNVPVPPSTVLTKDGKKKSTASSSTSSSAKPPSTQKKKQHSQQKKAKSAVAGLGTTTCKDTAEEAKAAQTSKVPHVSDSGAAPAATASQEGAKKKPTATSSTTKPPSAQKKPAQKKNKSDSPVAVPDAIAKDNPKVVGKAKTKGKAPSKGTATADTIVVPAKSTGSKKVQPKKTASSKSNSRAAPQGAMLDGFEGYIMDQATTLQIIQMQNGMTEEDALIEAIRMSEMEATRASSSSVPTKKISGAESGKVSESRPQPADEVTITPVTPTREGEPSRSSAASAKQSAVAPTIENGVDPTVRRLEFTPLAKSTVESASSTGTSESQAMAVSALETAAVPLTTAVVAVPTTAEDTAASSFLDPVVAKTPPATAAEEADTAISPTSSVTPSASDDSVAAVAVAATTESADGDTAITDTLAVVTSANEIATDTAVPAAAGGAPSEDIPKPKAKAKAASSSAVGKRKRPAAKTPPRKRPAKAGNSSNSRSGRTGGQGAGGQEESGYLTDEEALYLALRASEVEASSGNKKKTTKKRDGSATASPLTSLALHDSFACCRLLSSLSLCLCVVYGECARVSVRAAHKSVATLFFLRSVMGQACSCLQHRRKLERRASDESTLHDTDGDYGQEPGELDILIDGNGSSSNSGGADGGTSEFDELLGSGSSSSGGGRLRSGGGGGGGGGAFTKRNSSKNLRADLDETTSERTSSMSITSMATLEAEDQLQLQRAITTKSARLLGHTSESALSLEKNLEVLKSYQKATGVVDEGEMDLECVMCLDIFSLDNPKVRTLCNCGMNRTNFHMSCLMEWKNRDAKCPVCREYLFYED